MAEWGQSGIDTSYVVREDDVVSTGGDYPARLNEPGTYPGAVAAVRDYRASTGTAMIEWTFRIPSQVTPTKESVEMVYSTMMPQEGLPKGKAAYFGRACDKLKVNPLGKSVNETAKETLGKKCGLIVDWREYKKRDGSTGRTLEIQGLADLENIDEKFRKALGMAGSAPKVVEVPPSLMEAAEPPAPRIVPQQTAGDPWK